MVMISPAAPPSRTLQPVSTAPLMLAPAVPDLRPTAERGADPRLGVLLVPSAVSGALVTAYLVIVGYLALFRFISAIMRPGFQAEMAARWERWRRAFGHQG